MEWSTFLNQYVNKKNFDALILGWNTAIDPDQFSLWHSSQSGQGQYNFMSYNNKEVDDLLVKARTTFSKKDNGKSRLKGQREFSGLFAESFAG